MYTISTSKAFKLVEEIHHDFEVDGDLWGPIHLHLAARLGRLEELRQVGNSLRVW